MICNQCQQDKDVKDFQNSNICYKCIFKNKYHPPDKEIVSEHKLCKICKNQIPTSRLIYWKASYCSDECAKSGKNLHNKNYWVRNCCAPKVQKEFSYGKPKQI